VTTGLRVLVVNAGSSSLKVSLIENGRLLTATDGLPSRPPAVDAVGHRIVHGGAGLVDPVVIDASVERQLRDLADLAPLHQPKSLAGLAAARRLVPDVPHVACFDTAFHTTLPTAASTFALPQRWRDRWGVRRYGFHGLSHAWASSRARVLVPGARRVVTCHLGAGASLAAVLDGRSVDTTMGFTPLGGLVMATRSGTVDPGLVLWLQEHEGLSPHEVTDALEHSSGLLALAGTGDMREILARDDPQARLALDVYLHSLAAHVAAMTVALGGLDAIVFTGGVGEGAPAVRAGAAARLAHLGVTVDASRNDSITGSGPHDTDADADISGAGARVRTLVVRSREDLQIAAGVGQALAPAHTAPADDRTPRAPAR
jgi:acetate kinase